MTPQPPSPEAVEAANLKWESDVEVIGICKFPCVKNKNGTGVILTGQLGTEVQQLAALHNKAIDYLAAEVERLRARVAELEGMNTRLGVMCDKLLNHCDKESGECSECGKIMCPHECDLHFHHDGCPACAELGDGEPLHPERPKPLPRPDRPGWWWMWLPGEYNVSGNEFWTLDYVREDELPVSTEHAALFWLPATPPPAPTMETTK